MDWPCRQCKRHITVNINGCDCDPLTNWWISSLQIQFPLLSFITKNNTLMKLLINAQFQINCDGNQCHLASFLVRPVVYRQPKSLLKIFHVNEGQSSTIWQRRWVDVSFLKTFLYFVVITAEVYGLRCWTDYNRRTLMYGMTYINWLFIESLDALEKLKAWLLNNFESINALNSNIVKSNF